MADDGATNVPFDRATLESEIETLGQRLAELKYVDEAIAYVDAHHQTPSAGPGPRYDQIKVSIGWTYPFTRPLGMHVMPAGYPERVSRHLTGVAETASTWASNEIAVLHYLTTHITHPDVASYDYIVDELNDMASSMDDLAVDIGELGDDISWWKGDQAQDFAAFQSGHKHVVEHQQTSCPRSPTGSRPRRGSPGSPSTVSRPRLSPPGKPPTSNWKSAAWTASIQPGSRRS